MCIPTIITSESSTLYRTQQNVCAVQDAASGKYYPFMIDGGSTNCSSENKRDPSYIKDSVCNVLQGDQNDQGILFSSKSDLGDADIKITLIVTINEQTQMEATSTSTSTSTEEFILLENRNVDKKYHYFIDDTSSSIKKAVRKTLQMNPEVPFSDIQQLPLSKIAIKFLAVTISSTPDSASCCISTPPRNQEDSSTKRVSLITITPTGSRSIDQMSQTSEAESKPKPQYVVLYDKNGKSPNPANVDYRKLISLNKDTFKTITKKKDKEQFIDEVYKIFQERNFVFWGKDGKQLDEKAIKDKIKQAFRDNGRLYRKSKKKAKDANANVNNLKKEYSDSDGDNTKYNKKIPENHKVVVDMKAIPATVEESQTQTLTQLSSDLPNEFDLSDDEYQGLLNDPPSPVDFAIFFNPRDITGSTSFKSFQCCSFPQSDYVFSRATYWYKTTVDETLSEYLRADDATQNKIVSEILDEIMQKFYWIVYWFEDKEHKTFRVTDEEEIRNTIKQSFEALRKMPPTDRGDDGGNGGNGDDGFSGDDGDGGNDSDDKSSRRDDHSNQDRNKDQHKDHDGQNNFFGGSTTDHFSGANHNYASFSRDEAASSDSGPSAATKNSTQNSNNNIIIIDNSDHPGTKMFWGFIDNIRDLYDVANATNKESMSKQITKRFDKYRKEIENASKSKRSGMNVQKDEMKKRVQPPSGLAYTEPITDDQEVKNPDDSLASQHHEKGVPSPVIPLHSLETRGRSCADVGKRVTSPFLPGRYVSSNSVTYDFDPYEEMPPPPPRLIMSPTPMSTKLISTTPMGSASLFGPRGHVSPASVVCDFDQDDEMPPPPPRDDFDLEMGVKKTILRGVTVPGSHAVSGHPPPSPYPTSDTKKGQKPKAAVPKSACMKRQAPSPNSEARKRMKNTTSKKGDIWTQTTVTQPMDKHEKSAATILNTMKFVTGNKNDNATSLASAKLRNVTMRPSGKWQTQLYYAGKSRYIGVFDSKEMASLAYEIAKEKLKIDKPASEQSAQSIKEAEANVNAARKAAFEGVNEKYYLQNAK